MMPNLISYFGFSRTPFGRDLAPSMLHRHSAHNEAIARIGWCIAERRIGVITGEVGAGKTVAVRAALAALDRSRHTVIYLPDPTVGVRGIHHRIVASLGGQPSPTTPPWPTGRRRAGRRTRRAGPHAHFGRRGGTPARPRPIRSVAALDKSRARLIQPVRLPARRPTHPAAANETRRARRARPTHRAALHNAAHDRQGNRQLPTSPPRAGRARRHAVLRRCGRPHSSHQPGYPRAVNNLALQALVAAFAADKATVDESSTRTAIAEVTAD
ncbi:AAA domain protein [Mycobacterium xenopi 4042]|uniref:AAA domain protein n=1 Tax=Mycobacterium xenopi 4042 TaxID=1299334 RepID=X8CF43_MYCXE|nr:AAA domain protein [Mycobacterium xenopi 4042]